MQVKIRKISKEFSQLPCDSSSRSEQGREDSLHHGLGRGLSGKGLEPGLSMEFAGHRLR